MRLAPNSEPLPPSIEIPCFNTFSGDKEHDSYISTHKIDIHYSTYTRPVRPDQKDLFFDSENGEACYPLKIVPEVDEVSTYVLQMCRLGPYRACVFYDSGSNGNLIDGALAEKLSLKVVNDQPVVVGTAGAGGVYTQYGSYQLGVGPDQQGYFYTMNVQGILCVTDRFRKYKLYPINQELKDHDPLLGAERLPMRIGGMRTSLLIGINSKLCPILLTVLPSGLGVYRTQLKDELGSRIAYGGPHPVFSGVPEKAKGDYNHTMTFFSEIVTQYLRSPYVQMMQFNPAPQEETLPGLFITNNTLSPNMLSDDKLIDPSNDVHVKHYSFIHENCHILHAVHSNDTDSPDNSNSDISSFKSRVPLSKLKTVLDDSTIDDSVRCESCARCEKCSKSSKNRALSIQESYEQSLIENSVRYDPEVGRCFVRLPFLKDPIETLSAKHKSNSNYKQAYTWFKSMCKKPDEMKKSLILTMEDLVQRGFLIDIEKLSVERRQVIETAPFRHFLPWNIALKPDSPSTPFRFTVDATISGLNPILAKGLNKMTKIPELLMRVRAYTHMWSSDITKLYNRLLLEDDCLPYGLFLFNDDLDPKAPPKVYVTLVAWYGIASTGGQADEALMKVAIYHQNLYPRVPKILLRSRYVDDLMAFASLIADCESQANEVKECLAKGGFSLKFIAFSGRIPPPEASKESDSLKILGYKWTPVQDTISPGFEEINFNAKKRGARLPNVSPIITQDDVKGLLDTVDLTRRKIISQVASFYDPCGLWESYRLQLKLDCIPVNQFDWDTLLPPELAEYWATRLKEFIEIPFLKVNRCIVPIDAVDPSKIRLLGLADAAKEAGGAAIYGGFLKKDGSYSSSLLYAKSRLMTGTVPRNELDSIYLLVTMMKTVIGTLDELSVESMYYTDSRIAQCWVSNVSKPLKTFVATRVLYIRSLLLNPSEIYSQVPVPLFHIDGTVNACDLLTKEHDLTPLDLPPNGIWNQGYDWMTSASANLPKSSYEDLIISKDLEEEVEKECFIPIVSNVKIDRKIRPPTHHPHCSGCPQDIIRHPMDVCYGTLSDLPHCDNCTCSFFPYVSAVKAGGCSANSLNVSMLRLGWKLGLKTIVLTFRFIHVLRHRVHLKKGVSVMDECEICKTKTSVNERKFRESLEHKSMQYLLREESKLVAKNVPKKKLDTFVYFDGIYHLHSRLVDDLSVVDLEGISLDFFDSLNILEYIPVVLSKSELFYALIIHVHTNVRPHSGVNITFKEIIKTVWPLNNPLRYIQAVRQDCTRCRAIKKKGMDLKMQNHPKVRTTIAPPFYTIAIDIVYGFKVQWYPGSKRVNNGYALAIVCLLTGAVNILTMEGLHTRDVLSALERHSNRYSPPGILYCDSGSQLVSLDQSKFTLRDLSHNLSDSHGVEVRVVTAKDHTGNGRCESRVRLLRQMLEKLGVDTTVNSMTHVQWETLFSHISQNLNDIPIAKGNRSSIDDFAWDVITPNRLLLGKNVNRSLNGNIEMESGPELGRLMEKNRKILETWYKIFVEHLYYLIPRPTGKWHTTDPVNVGDVVLFVFKENAVMKQDVWKLARVVEIFSPTKVRLQYSIKTKRGDTEVKFLERNPRQLCMILGEDEYGINTYKHLEKLRSNCESKGI